MRLFPNKVSLRNLIFALLRRCVVLHSRCNLISDLTTEQRRSSKLARGYKLPPPPTAWCYVTRPVLAEIGWSSHFSALSLCCWCPPLNDVPGSCAGPRGLPWPWEGGTFFPSEEQNLITHTWATWVEIPEQPTISLVLGRWLRARHLAKTEMARRSRCGFICGKS